MTRREVLRAVVDVGRLGILRLRVRLGRPLPAILAALLVQLDAWAKRLERSGRR